MVVGYSLSGIVTERIVVSMYGTGSNGKSTFLNAVQGVCGDYGKTVPAATFEKASFAQGGGAASPQITQFKGARFVSTSEVEDGMKIAVNLLKVLSGNDVLVGRDLYASKSLAFRGTHTVWIAANSKLNVPSDDQAVWDRMKFIPFEARITDDMKDRDIDIKLASEAPGVLAWAVRGCVAWQARGA